MFTEYHIVKLNGKEVDRYRTLLEIIFLLENNQSVDIFIGGTIKNFNFSTIRKYTRDLMEG